MKDVNQLVINYMPLANKIAWKRFRSLPKCVNIEEVQSAAYMGLVDAAQKFNDKKGSFGSYARLRISGEITDYLRSLNWIVEISLDQKIGEQTLANIALDSKNIFCYHEREEFFYKTSTVLTESQNRIFKMYYLEEKTFSEIALEEGVSISRISQILKQCRNQIKDRFTKSKLIELVA